MTALRGTRSFVAAGILLLALTSCSDDVGDPEATGTPSPTSQSPAPTSSPPDPSLSPSEKAAEDVEALVQEYYSTLDQLRQDANRPLRELKSVASSTELLVMRNLISGDREKGYRVVGNVELVQVNVESINLDQPPTAIVDVCWDVTDSDVVDGDGKSIVSPDRKDVGWTRLTVTNMAWEEKPTLGWRVSGGRDLEKSPCSGS